VPGKRVVFTTSNFQRSGIEIIELSKNFSQIFLIYTSNCGRWVNGNMALALVKEDLMIRVGPESYDKLMSQPYKRKMDFTGKPLKGFLGFLYISSKGTESDKDLKKWVLIGVEFARSVSAKKSK
jgi:hypothetical protein